MPADPGTGTRRQAAPPRRPKRPPEGTGAKPPRKVELPTSFGGGTLLKPPRIGALPITGKKGTAIALSQPTERGGRAGKRKEVPFSPRPDTVDRRTILRAGGGGVRAENLARGAKTSGGPGTKEIKAFTEIANAAARRPTGEHVAALQRNLRKQGYDIAVDGIWGPQSQRAMLKAQGVMGKTAKIEYKRRVKRVLADPESNPQEMVELFGFEGAEKLGRAWQQERIRRLAELNRAKPDDPGFMDIVTGVAQAIPGATKTALTDPVAVRGAAGRLGKWGAESATRALIEGAYEADDRRGGSAALRGATAAGAGVGFGIEKAIEEGIIGPDLAAFLNGREYSESGLKFDLAMAPLAVIGRPIRAGRVSVSLARAIARGERDTEALARAAGEIYHGPTLLGQTIRTRKINKAIQKADAEITAAQIANPEMPLPKALTAAHGRAMKAAREADIAVETHRAASASVKGKEAKKAAEKEKNRLAGIRKAAYNEEAYHRMRHKFDDTPVDGSSPHHATRTAVARDLVKQLKTRQGALPQTVRTEAQVGRLFSFLDKLIDYGMEGRKWYENSAKAILDHVDGDPRKAEQIAQLIAIYSPQQPIIGNLSLAIRAWNEFQETGAVTVGDIHKQAKAVNVLQGGKFEGRKTNNFYVNFLEDIDPEEFRRLVDAGEIRPDGVTIDIWMARVFGYTDSKVTDTRYDFMEPIVRVLAAERGSDWKPKQVQAAIWTAIKAHSLTDTSANIDFADAFRRHLGQFNWRVAPGFQSSFRDTYESWPEEVQLAYQLDSAELVDDYLRSIGMISNRTEIGPGFYDGPEGLEFNHPAAATEVATSAAPRPSKEAEAAAKAAGEEKADYFYRVHPTEKARLDRAAASIGEAFELDEVSWIRPSEAVSPGHEDTRLVNLGRAATNEEAETLWRALNPDGRERIMVLHAPDGLVVRNTSADIPNIGTAKNPGLREMAHTAVEDMNVDASIEGFASDGNQIRSGDYGSHLSDGYAGGLGADGGSVAASHRLAREAAALRARYGAAFPVGRFDDPAPFVAATPADGVAHAEGRELAEASVWQREVAPEGAEPDSSTEDWIARSEEETLAAQKALGLLGDAEGEVMFSGVPVTPEGVSAAVPRPTLRTNALDTNKQYTARYAETLSGKKVQLHQPRSWIANQTGVKIMDAASRAVGRSDRISDTRGVRVMSMHERAVKGLGRQQRFLSEWYKAKFAPELRVLSRVKADSAKDVAHWWWQQLPERLRTNDGLRLIQGRQREELARLVPGPNGEPPAALRSIQRQRYILKLQLEVARDEKRFAAMEDELKTRLRAEIAQAEQAGDAEAAAEARELLASRADFEDIAPKGAAERIERDLVTLDKMEEDLPDKIKDVTRSIARLDEVIADEVKLDPNLMKALASLAEDRTEILKAATRLDPAKAEARRGTVARWLGEEPDGTEVYAGHRMTATGDDRSGYGGIGGLGKVKGPAGAGTKNRQMLVSTGRVHASVHVSANDWMQAQSFRQALTDRAHLSEIGRAFDPSSVPGYPHIADDEILMNPAGELLPKHWRTYDAEQFSDKTADVERIRKLAEEMTNLWLKDSGRQADYDDLIAAAIANGQKPSELRVVKRRDVERYYAQFKTGAPRSETMKVVDTVVDATAVLIVTARLGYIPKNIVQNLTMALVHQGPMLLPNAVRTAQILGDPELKRILRRFGADITEDEIMESRRVREMMRSFAGSSGAHAAIAGEMRRQHGPISKHVQKILNFIRSVADDPVRMSAFVHEMAAQGVFGQASKKVAPLFTHSDRRAMMEFWTNERHREQLFDTFWSATESMADFSRLNPDQARKARRLLVVPSWLMAGTRYPFKMAQMHPVRTALLAYLALGDPADNVPDDLWFEEPFWEYINGEGYLQGIDTRWGRLRTSSLNPAGMPEEVALSVYGSLKGGQSPYSFEEASAWDKAAPILSTAQTIASGQGRSANLPFTSTDIPTIGELGRVMPQVDLIYDLIAGAKPSPSYPGEDTRWERLARELGVIPIQVGGAGGEEEDGGDSGEGFWGGSEDDDFWGGGEEDDFWSGE